MLISISCWGDWHTDVFCRFGLPSLLPQLLPDDHLVIHTLERDAPRIRRAAPGADVGLEIAHMLEKHLGSGKRIATKMWRRDFDRARAAGDVIAMISPDVVFGATCFPAYRRLLGEGRTAIFQQLPRVNYDGAENVLGLAGDNRDLAAVALNFEHHLSTAYRADSRQFPEHAELVNWRAPCGLLAKMLAASPLVVDPLRHELTSLMLLDAAAGPRFGWIADSDDAIALSLTPALKDLDWLVDGAADIDRLRAFQARYASPSNRELGARTYRLHAGPVPDAAWEDLEAQAAALAACVFDPLDGRSAA